MSDEEDENKKDWGKEKKSPDKKPEKKDHDDVDDGLNKERRTQQLIDGVTRLSRVITPIDTIIQDDQSQVREGIINRFELNDLRQRLEQTERQNNRIELELEKANLDTRRVKLQLENLKATSHLKLERAELETEKVRFQGQKEKAETLIEMLKMQQELQQVRRDNHVKSVEIIKLKAELRRVNMQVGTSSASENLLPGADNMASYMSSGMQFLAMQQSTQLLQGRMLHTHRNNTARPMNRTSANHGEGFYVCAQCMVAEFPNSLEGQRMLEAHLETEHPQRAALSEAPIRDHDMDDKEEVQSK
ncbi:uncharacterized protein [Amphiura filiformis]|uniref:uncharacterized protein n=1 Tax=Amphiura filiformis TaxID=82378 RepID=UPI003B222E5C